MNRKVYIEAGAVDGVFQSRSLCFKDDPDYFGILVEPDTRCIDDLKKNRQNENTLIVNAALVPFTFEDRYIDIRLHNTTACNSTSLCKEERRTDQWDNSVQTVQVKALTLQSILDENKITEIEHLFLDTEGFEEEIINGIDHTRVRINNAEIEVHGTIWPEHLQHGIQVFSPLMKDRYNLNLVDIIHDGCPKLVFNRKDTERSFNLV
jgi:FkbM family methyltransferase